MRNLAIRFGWKDSFWMADAIRISLRLPVRPCFCPMCRKPEKPENPPQITIPFGPMMVEVVQLCVDGGCSVAFLAKRLNVSHKVIRACLEEPRSAARMTASEVVELAA